MTRELDKAHRLLSQCVGWQRDAEIEKAKLRALLTEARQYVSDAGNDEDGETQRNSAALLADIGRALEPKP